MCYHDILRWSCGHRTRHMLQCSNPSMGCLREPHRQQVNTRSPCPRCIRYRGMSDVFDDAADFSPSDIFDGGSGRGDPRRWPWGWGPLGGFGLMGPFGPLGPFGAFGPWGPMIYGIVYYLPHWAPWFLARAPYIEEEWETTRRTRRIRGLPSWGGFFGPGGGVPIGSPFGGVPGLLGIPVF